MLHVIANIYARNPPAILLTLGGIGYLAGLTGAGALLTLGFILQLVWLARFFV